MTKHNLHLSLFHISVIFISLVFSISPEITFAQQGTGAETLEEVVVTGSRIKRKDLNANIPLSILNKADIDVQSVQIVSELVRDLPSVSGASQSTHSSNGGGDGTADITLRGLPSEQTLVLLNGRRMPFNASSLQSETVDINTIPVGDIERIEILKEGASALYGSEAIAGVVNIITRKDFDGIEIEGQYGEADNFPVKSANILFGKNFDNGNITLGFNWYKQDDLPSRDRNISRVTLAPSSSPPWVYVGDLGLTLGCGSTVKNATAADYREFDGSGPCINGSGGDYYNYQDFVSSIVALERRSYFGSGHYDFTDNVSGFFEGSFTETEDHFYSAPVPLFTAFENPNLTVAANQPYNPFGVQLSDFRRRFIEMGPREDFDQIDQKHVVAGLEGKFNDWDWTAAVNWGRTDTLELATNNLNKSNLQLALGDPANCAALAANGCVPINVFGSGLGGAITPDMMDWVRQDVAVDNYTDMLSLTFDVARANIYQLPAGPVGFAAGIEYREESMDFDADQNSNRFNTIGSINQLDGKGDRSTFEFYTEVGIPLLESVEANVSFRYSDYSDFGTTINPKVSVGITPEQFIPGLRIRGSYSEGFRAPSLRQLYLGGNENFGFFNDPCVAAVAGGPPITPLPGCGALGGDPALIQFLAVEGGNPDLKPEESTSYTIGASYSPDWMTGLNMSLDYYNIDITNAINVNSQFVIDQAAAGVAGFVNSVVRNAAGNIQVINSGYLNLAARSTSGLDYSVDYTTQDYDWGRLNLAFNGNYVIDFLDAPDASVAPVDITGVFLDAAAAGLGSIPQLKWTFSGTWNYQQWMANVRVHYISELKEVFALSDPLVIENTMDSWTTVDFQGSYTTSLLGADTTIIFGIDNVTDEEPPLSVTSFNDNMDVRTHNIIGRFLYTRLHLKF